MAEHLWRRIGRRLRSPVKYSYGDRSSAYSVRRVRPSGRFFDSTAAALLPRDPLRGHCEAGSLTGAVHLSNDNAGVQGVRQGPARVPVARHPPLVIMPSPFRVKKPSGQAASISKTGTIRSHLFFLCRLLNLPLCYVCNIQIGFIP